MDTSRIQVFAPSLLQFGFLNFQTFDFEREKYVRALNRWRDRILQLSLYADVIYVPEHHTLDLNRLYEDGKVMDTEPRNISVHYEYYDVAKRFGRELAEIRQDFQPLSEAGVIRHYEPSKVFLDHISVDLLGSRRLMSPDEIREGGKDMLVTEGLHFARVFNVPYTALTKFEFNRIHSYAEELERLGSLDQKVINGLVSLQIPRYSYAAGDVVRARRQLDEFAAFRSLLRETFANAPSAITSTRDAEDYRQLMADKFLPKLKDLRRARKLHQAAAQNLKSGAISFSAGAVAAYALSQDFGTAIASGAVTAGAQALLQTASDLAEKPEAQVGFMQRVFF